MKTIQHYRLSLPLLCGLSILGLSFTLTSDKLYREIEKDIWEKYRFSRTITKIKSHIEKEGYTAVNVPQQLIYYKGVSYCCNEEINYGKHNFDWILSNFNLSPDALLLINEQKSNCVNGTTPPEFNRLYGNDDLTDVNMVVEVAQPGVRVETKGFYKIDWNNPENFEVNSAYIGEEPVETAGLLKKYSYQQLRARIVQETSEEAIKDSLKVRLRKMEVEPTILLTEHFIMINYIPFNQAAVKNELDRFEKALTYLSNTYELSVPPEKITIYLTNNKEDMASLGTDLHGLDLNKNLLGYAVEADLSLVAYAPDFNMGTLKHELMHLLLNYNFKALAPWLSEGIAAIYETSYFSGDELIGESNWRGKILDGALEHNYVLDIKSLLSLNWLEYNAYNGDTYNSKRLSVHHALSRYFCMYLFEQDKLVAILNAYTHLSPNNIDKSLDETVLSIVESAFNKPIAKIQKDFIDWYSTKHYRY